MRPLLAAALLVVTLASAPVAAQALPSVPLPPELDRVLRDYERAWAGNDPAALAGLFSADGMALPNGQQPARGFESIRKAYVQSAGVPLSLRALAHAVSGDLAYVIGGYGMSPQQPDFGKFVLVLRRGGDGRWLIAADIENTNMPLPPAPDVSPQAGSRPSR